MKDTGADMPLVREDLINPSSIIEGRSVTLYTVIGQPFKSKIAIVQLDIPYFSGYTQVGVVADLAAEALLGMDVLNKKCSSSFAVTRASSMRKQKLEESRQQAMTESDVKPRNLDVENNSANMSENEDQVDLQDNDVYVQDHDFTKPLTIPDVLGINVETLIQMQNSDKSLEIPMGKALSTWDESEGLKEAFFYENDILKRKWQSDDQSRSGIQVVLPKQLRNIVVTLAHDRPLAGHLGVEKTKQRVLRSFYWPGVFRDVKNYCASCDTCQKVAKRTHQRAPLQIVPTVGVPFRKISMDVVGPLPRTSHGNKFIITVIDDATRYPEAFAMPSVEAEKVANVLIELVYNK